MFELLAGLFEALGDALGDAFGGDAAGSLHDAAGYTANGHITFAGMGDGRFDTDITSSSGNAVGGNTDGTFFDRGTGGAVDRWGNPI